MMIDIKIMIEALFSGGYGLISTSPFPSITFHLKYENGKVEEEPKNTKRN